MRIRPRHSWLAAAGYRAMLPVAERILRSKHIHRVSSSFAASRRATLRRLRGGEAIYLAGISVGGFHNTGVALVELTREGGPKIVCNNEEERFSSEKHTNKYPRLSLDALKETVDDLGIAPERIGAWLATYDYPLYMATGFRTVLEEFPASMSLLWQDQ